MNTLLLDNPALSDPEWLPEDASEELNALRERHRRLLRSRQQAAAGAAQLDRDFEADDKARAEALKEAYAAGQDRAEVADTTPPEERKEQLARLRERVKAANEALGEFVAEAVAEIKAKVPEWSARLDAEAGAAESKREEAARLLAEAEAEEVRLTVLRMWLQRTARDTPGWHIPFAVLYNARTEQPPSLADIANRGVSPEARAAVDA